MKKSITLFLAFLVCAVVAQAQFTLPVTYINAFPANIITGGVPAGNVTRGYGIIGSPLSDALPGYRVKQISFKGVNKTDSVSLWGGWIDSVTTTGTKDTVWSQLWLKPMFPYPSSKTPSLYRDTTRVKWATDVGIDNGVNWGTYDFSDNNFDFYQLRRGIIDSGKVFYRIRALGF